MQKITKFVATPEEKLKLLYDCLCNGMGYFGAYGLRVDVNDADYNNAKKTAKSEDGGQVCYEDVLVEMLKNSAGIDLLDTENDDELVGTISLANLNKNWDVLPQRYMEAMESENYDANDCDCILQVIAFGEVTYG